MTNSVPPPIEIEIKRRTIAKVYFVLALGAIAGFIFGYFYLT